MTVTQCCECTEQPDGSFLKSILGYGNLPAIKRKLERERKNMERERRTKQRSTEASDTYEFRRRHVQAQVAQGDFMAALRTGHQPQRNIETLQSKRGRRKPHPAVCSQGLGGRGVSFRFNRGARTCSSLLQTQAKPVSPWEHCLSECAKTDLAHCFLNAIKFQTAVFSETVGSQHLRNAKVYSFKSKGWFNYAPTF